VSHGGRLGMGLLLGLDSTGRHWAHRKERRMLSRTLLAHVAPLSTVQVENLATNALDYLFTKYPAAAEAFVGLARQAAPSLPEPLQFRTQARWEDGAIPDMVGLHDKVQVLLIEAKFWAGLTSNQPVTYLNRLPESSGGLVLLICPAQRTQRLWEQVTGRCSAAGMVMSPTTVLKPGFQATSVGPQRYLAQVTWDVLLSELESAMSEAGRAEGVTDLDQLRGLCERIDEEALRPLSLLDSSESAELDLTCFVDEIVSGLVASGHAQTEGYRATPGAGYYKRYMKLHGWGNWCVEWNVDYISRFGQTSLWLSTTMNKAQKLRLEQLGSLLGDRCRVAGTQFLIPLAGPDGFARIELLQDVMEKISEVRQSFVASAHEDGSAQRPATR